MISGSAESVVAGLLDTLAGALAAEREALLGNDAEALVAAAGSKLAALARLEAEPLDPAISERIAELAAFNRANGALLARRQREVRWALRHLGRVEAVSSYDPRGRIDPSPHARVFAHA